MSPNFLVWKFCGKTRFPHSFGGFARDYAETEPFRKIFRHHEIRRNYEIFQSVTLNEKKNHHCTIKICCLQIWKKSSTLDGNLNVHYIWQNNAMNFLQILFKGQRLIIVLVHCFGATCLIIFLYFQYFDLDLDLV